MALPLGAFLVQKQSIIIKVGSTSYGVLKVYCLDKERLDVTVTDITANPSMLVANR